MRVGPYTPPMQGRQQKQYQQQASRSESPMESPAMHMTKRILAEQGERQAGYFLFAAKPFIAPAEIAQIERQLQIRAECAPEPPHHRGNQERSAPQQQPQQQGGGFKDLQMMQMFMNMMSSMNSDKGGKMDPMMLLKLMNNG